jgi:hypothetical protein
MPKRCSHAAAILRNWRVSMRRVSVRHYTFCALVVYVALSVLAGVMYALTEQVAKTDDGRTVILSDDGTWKFQSPLSSAQSQTADLAIEAGLVYETGPRPVARERFCLLDLSLADLVKPYRDATAKHRPLTIQSFAVYLTWIGAGTLDGHGPAERSVAESILRDIQRHVVKEVTTDFNGRARFEGLPPGPYHLFGASVRTGKGAVVWNVPVELKSGANSLILDQHNAAGID